VAKTKEEIRLEIFRVLLEGLKKKIEIIRESENKYKGLDWLESLKEAEIKREAYEDVLVSINKLIM